MSDDNTREDSTDAGRPSDTPQDRINDAGPGDGEQPQVINVARPGGRRAFLHTLSRGAAVGATAVVGDACNSGTPTQPTGVAAAPTISTSTTTVRTTTTVAPTSTLAGVVTDRNGKPVGGCRVFVVDGPNRDRSSTTDGNGYYSIGGLVTSSFTLRTTCGGVFVGDRPVTISSDTRLDFSLTVTTSTSTTTTSTRTTSTGGGGGGGGHYWYPN